MLPSNTAINSRLFQPWQPVMAAGTSGVQAAAQQPEYIELPKVHCYEQLEWQASFPKIKSRFLSDIQEMKQLVHPFVNHQYDKAIDVFHNKLKWPSGYFPEYLYDHLLPLYRETRFQIHQLVRQLKEQQNNPDADNKDYIASVLHECLESIEDCPPGVHSRFNQSFLNLEASRAGLAGKLFKVRSELFHQFIQSFMLEQQREGRIEVLPEMEIHWFNRFHNLFCESLGLSPIVDRGASPLVPDDILQRFISAALMSVNACTVLRKLSSEWSDQLSATLKGMGEQAWETETIAPDELTSDKTGTLDSTFFKPVNLLLNTTGEQSLNLSSMIEETDDGNYHLGRYREKLLAWAASHFSDSSAEVFSAIPGGTNSASYIGTINELFFWVFDHNQTLPAGQACTFAADKHTTLTLSHLTSIDFSTWPGTTSCALLTQAMEQTDKAEPIASFFLQQATIEQLRQAPEVLVKALSSQLCDKLIKSDNTFKETLCKCVCDHFASGQTAIAPDSLDWLINTPLLKPVLLGLQQQGIDVTPISRKLASWQISDFSHDDLKKMLTPNHCKRLFRQAFKLRQIENLSNLLLTGHCDQLAIWSVRRVSPLSLFAISGNLPGLEYLLKLDHPAVNQQNSTGWRPLHSAVKYGHVGCVRALLAAQGIEVNPKDNYGWTPLNLAAYGGKADCVRELVAAHGIDVNAKNNFGYTPLHSAARRGHTACVRELLQSDKIKINERARLGCCGGKTALMLAIENKHEECAKLLIQHPKANVNKNSRSLDAALAKAREKQLTGIINLLEAVPRPDNSFNRFVRALRR